MIVNIFYKAAMPKYYRATAKYRAAVVKALSKKRGEVNIIFVGKSEILRVNKQYLKHNYVTDVITFPYAAHGGPLGDIFICFEQGLKQAKEEGHGGLKELLIIAAHGALHLAGWDDDKPKKRAAMNAYAAQITGKLLCRGQRK